MAFGTGRFHLFSAASSELVRHGNKFHINILQRAKITTEQLNCLISDHPDVRLVQLPPPCMTMTLAMPEEYYTADG